MLAFRNLLRHRAFSLINILGLAIGMAACLIILNYVQGELSFDSFHSKRETIYRIRNDHYGNNTLAYSGVFTYPALGPAMKEDFPEVIEYARLLEWGDCIISAEKKSFKEEKYFFADPSFLRMFSFEVAEGNRKSLLSSPNTILLTETAAKKYFGSSSPIGRILTFKDDDISATLKVEGIMKDAPYNSHLQFDFLISYKTLHQLESEYISERSWFEPSFITYLELQSWADPKEIEKKLPAFVMKHNGKHLTETNQKEVLFLEPLKDIYLHSKASSQNELSGNGFIVYALSILAFFILVIAWVNYINLSTAKAVDRAKEVGVRKVIGASRFQLIRQFMGESALLNSIALVIAITIFQISLPLFNSFISKPENFHFNLGSNPIFWTVLVLFFLFGAAVSGIYPAFVLSTFNPIRAFKEKNPSGKGWTVRKILVVFQFTCSVGLIAGTLIIYKQINFMRNKNLGVNIGNTIVLHAPTLRDQDSVFLKKTDVFKQEVLKLSGVGSFTSSHSIPGKKLGQQGGVIRRVEAPLTDVHNFKVVWTDKDFFKVYKNKFVHGRGFSNEKADKNKVVINEAASLLLGFSKPSEAVGRRIVFPGENAPKEVSILGVIKNYHHQSLKQGFDPIIFTLSWSKKYYSLRLDPHVARASEHDGEKLKLVITKVEEIWKKTYPGNPFNYFFLDEAFDRQYKEDLLFGRVFGLFTCLAIFIACLGLYGLASLTTIQRTKEIGIRKVLGASLSSLLILLSKDLIKLVLVASCIALPFSWYFMKEWLQNYAFRIDISPAMLIIPSFAVIIIAVMTISYQTMRTARENPVKSIKSE